MEVEKRIEVAPLTMEQVNELEKAGYCWLTNFESNRAPFFGQTEQVVKPAYPAPGLPPEKRTSLRSVWVKKK